jgi:hypothetical protein
MQLLRVLSLLTFLVVAAPLSAQQADVLTGRVVGADGRPMAGARVEAVSAETEISRSVITDANGRYMILFPDGGGRYLLRVTFIGMGDVVQAVIREAEEELLLTNITMQSQAIALDAINVQAQRPQPGDGRAGEQSTEMTQALLNRLPLPDLDPNTVALLAAGVVGTALDSVSGQMGFSVAGMSDLLNQVTLDGVIMGEGGMGVPEEGIRRTSITTSTFDASRGGFAGGMVSMMSARGNNRPGGALSYRLDNDALQSTASATTNAFSRHWMSASYGGPLISNKLFYNTSLQLSRNTNHRFALAANDPLGAQRSGVATDSIARFLSILQGQHGFEVFGQTGPYNQVTDDIRVQGRVDWNIAQSRAGSQTLSVRFNTNLNTQDSTRINPLDLVQHGGDMERNNTLASAALTSRLRTNWTNAMAMSFSESWNQTFPYAELPEGTVRITSDFEDGTRGTSRLVFGGNRSMPTERYTRDLQFSNDLSLLQPIGSQIHRLKLGGSVQYSKDVSRSTDNLFGSFSYASLEDFFGNRPDRYERSLTERQSRTGSLNTGIYIGDTWRITMPLELTLGLRWDRSQLDQKPTYNPLVEQLFGRRTDMDPVASAISPRIGFNYRLNQQGQPARALSGGIGMFAGRPPTSIFSAAVRQTGLPDAEQRLVCIGDAVPIPDWDLYQRNPLAVPATCADGGSGELLTSRAPNVTLIASDQALPSSLRFDLGYRAQLPYQLNANMRYTYSRGMGLWGYRDLNIDESRRFTLQGEGRPFYGDASGIVQRTGATSLASSRIHEEFGNVYEVTADRESEAHQMTASVTGWLPIRMMFSLNYTLGFSRDQGSGGMGMGALSVPTAGSPNDVEWATGSNDRRHTMNLILSYPLTPWAEISGMSRISSGSPFTPMVNRDINGDGMRNDRAFVFDPFDAATDPALAAGMLRLLESTPARVRGCLESQFGTIADRNSCRNSWSQSFDVRASLRPNLPQLERRLTMSADFRNVLTGLDQVINGRANLKGWGEGQRADANLLEVRGFDPVTSRFIYEVNEGFGQTRRGPSAFRNAFSVTLSGRVAIGGQPMMNNRAFGNPMGMLAGMGGAMGGAGGRGGFGGGGVFMGAGGVGELMAMFRGGADAINVDSILGTMMVNPVLTVIQMKDSLGLSAEQLSLIQQYSDTLQAQLERRRATLAPTLQSMVAGLTGGGAQPQAMQQVLQQLQLQVQPNLTSATREAAEALTMTRRELTAEQWDMLPQSVRSAAEQQQRGAGGFNAVGMIDRMLANPIPVLLELKDTLKLTPDQVQRVQAVSDELQVRLSRRREELGRRFDNVEAQQQGRIFQEIQPDLERTRNEVTAALRQVERILTKEQWEQVPERIRSPFQNTGPGGMRRGGGS